MNCLVLLAGCGLGDGSCIEEAVLTYAVLDKYHCSYTPAAENISVPSIDHLTEQPGEPRNILTESARIGRGQIQPLNSVILDEYDALILPGGIGLLTNYRSSEAVRGCVEHFILSKKPVGTMCAGIDFLRGFLGAALLQAEEKELAATEFCCDQKRAVFYTPAFRQTKNCYHILLGIDAMICAMKQSLEQPV